MLCFVAEQAQLTPPPLVSLYFVYTSNRMIEVATVCISLSGRFRNSFYLTLAKVIIPQQTTEVMYETSFWRVKAGCFTD